MTTSPQPESPELLKVVAHMRADGSAWSGYASCRPGDVEAFAVTRLSDAEAAIQAARNEAEAMRAELFAAADEALKLTRLNGSPQLPRLFEAVRAIQCSRSGG